MKNTYYTVYNIIHAHQLCYLQIYFETIYFDFEKNNQSLIINDTGVRLGKVIILTVFG